MRSSGGIGVFHNEYHAVDPGNLYPGAGRKVRTFDTPTGIVHRYLADTVYDRMIKGKNSPGILLASLIEKGLIRCRWMNLAILPPGDNSH